MNYLRRWFIEQRLAADKVAALRAVGMEFEGNKARNIREQHEAQSKGAREGLGMSEKAGDEVGRANGAPCEGSCHAIAVGSHVSMLVDPQTLHVAEQHESLSQAAEQHQSLSQAAEQHQSLSQAAEQHQSLSQAARCLKISKSTMSSLIRPGNIRQDLQWQYADHQDDRGTLGAPTGQALHGGSRPSSREVMRNYADMILAKGSAS